MRFNYLGLVFILFLLSSCSKKELLSLDEQNWLKQQPELKVSIFANYPPYLFENNNGNVDGVFIDYIDLIEKKINYSFKKVYYSNWSELYKDASNSKVDIVLDIQKTKERELLFDFYSEIFSSDYVVVTRKGKETTFDELISSDIIIPKDYAISDILKKAIPNVKINTYADEKTCLEVLSKGNHDVYIGPKSVVNYFIHELNLSNLVISDVTPYDYIPGISVTKSEPILSKIIEKAVKSISQKEIDIIFDNWLFLKVKPFYRKMAFWIGIIALLGIVLAAITYFNRLLNLKVKNRTAALEIAIKNAKKSNAVKTRFIQNISHEIRTPLNSILGFSELLRKENATNKEHLSYVDTIIDSGKNLFHVVDSILEISSFRTESAKINLEEINLKKVFNNVEYYFEAIANKKNLYLNFSTKINDDVVVLTDKSKLQKIIVNLVDNALKFTKQGGVDVTYNFLPNNLLEIKVKDTGKGIKKENKEAIFDSFSQLENELSDHYTGLGIGLTIVKETVNTLKGNISFESSIGQGTSFYVNLPCEKVTNPINSTLVIEKSSYTILVVEDAQINFLLVKSILKKMNTYDFTILHAENGKIGVEMCDMHPEINLVIMDIRMPVMNGYDATALIRKKHPHLNIIAHTAYSSDSDIQKALEVGCKTVLAKPVEMEPFKETVVKYLCA